MNRFDGKTVVITGAASGLGRATVERVAGEGANVVLVEGHGGEPRGDEGGYRERRWSGSGARHDR